MAARSRRSQAASALISTNAVAAGVFGLEVVADAALEVAAEAALKVAEDAALEVVARRGILRALGRLALVVTFFRRRAARSLSIVLIHRQRCRAGIGRPRISRVFRQTL